MSSAADTAEPLNDVLPIYWPNIKEPFSDKWEYYSSRIGLLISLVGLILGLFVSKWYLFICPIAIITGICIGFEFEKWRLRPNLSHIEKQLEKRGAIPESYWGNDPLRVEMAMKIVDKAYISWQSKNFIPKDPFGLIVYPHTYSNNDPTMLSDLSKEIIARELTPEEIDELLKGTFGEVVDFFLNKNNWQHNNQK